MKPTEGRRVFGADGRCGATPPGTAMYFFVAVVLGVFAASPAGPGAAVAGAADGDAPEDVKLRRRLLETFVSEFVAVTPGKGQFPKSFRMGTEDGPKSEGPAHDVTFAHDFSIAKYEVPQNLWVAVTGSNPSRWKGPRNSVELFTHAEARDFCRRLTDLLHAEKLIPATSEIRLPTEAEWEYCCRAGTTTKYGFGDAARKPDEPDKKASLLDPYAWHTGNAAGNDPPVGAKKPNAWGLYDMHGYLWELTEDAWHEDHAEAPTDGRARTDGPLPKKFVARGGSWKDRWDRLTSTSRMAVAAETKDDALGLRCVMAARATKP